ncbi:metallopeptidase TldD-related protein [Candidatus Avelusimicrobium luingense]|uniref:metallopeptidase TldD-related protein n=1 Tax=Candidatus Avelusimicrobium luingense TaxID=3416211 RepID=UPI003D122C90
MKRILYVMVLFLVPGILTAAPWPNNEFFRAMNDEMQRTLKQLRLKGHPDPYYVAYWAKQSHSVNVRAQMGTLVPMADTSKNKIPVQISALVSVGSDKEDALNFVDASTYMPGVILSTRASVPVGYESIRQALWELTDDIYLSVVNLYQAKKAYKQKKNIQDKLPDIVPAKPGRFVEEIPPFQRPDLPRLEQAVKEMSALGNEIAFIENFSAGINSGRNDIYFLNSRGAFAQYMRPQVSLTLRASWRQPNGKKENEMLKYDLPDTSDASLAQMKVYAQEFLARIERAHGAKSGDTYIGPVLLKPRMAATLLWNAILNDMQQTKPLLRTDTHDDDDPSAGKLNKKRGVRVSTDLLTIYDRPLARDFEGIALARFSPVDDEGVASENITLVENGYVKEIPLSQRPISPKHRSNGHGFFDYFAMNVTVQSLRERLTNVFVEPKEQLTDRQMEEKLLARCRELGLEYGYIIYDGFGPLGIERIYTADGHKETILDLNTDSDNFNFMPRDLRSVLAVGGKKELVHDYEVTITPSILLSEMELVPKDPKPHRKPFIERPK